VIRRWTWRVLVVAAAGYGLTWAIGVPASRSAIADGIHSRVLPQLTWAPAYDIERDRVKLRAYSKAEGEIVVSRPRLDVVFIRSTPIFPGLIVSHYDTFVDATAIACTGQMSVVACYGIGCTVVYSVTGAGFNWGPPG